MSKRMRVAAAAVVVGLLGIGACSRIADDVGGGSQADRATLRDAAGGADHDTGSTTNAFAATEEVATPGAVAALTAEGAATGSGAAQDRSVVAATDEAAGAPLPQGIGAPKV